MSRGRLSPRERQDRDERIRAAAGRGEHPAAIGRREGVSERQARRIIAAQRQQHERPPVGPTVGSVLEIDPHAELARAVEAHRWAVSEARQIGERTAAASVRLGAARTVAALSADLLAILTRAGLSPASEVEWLGEAGLRQAVAALREVAVEVGVEPEAVDAVLERRLADLRGAPELAMAA